MKSDNPDDVKPDSGESWSNRLYQLHPRVMAALKSLKHNPMSGNALRALIKGEDGSQNQLQERTVGKAQSPPVTWQRTSPIVVSQYTALQSDQLFSFWGSTFPDLEKQYSELVRYEHHDVIPFESNSSNFEMATMGRAIQDQEDDSAFWKWLNNLIINGVDEVGEARALIDGLGIDVDSHFIDEAIENRLYEETFQRDTKSMLNKFGPSVTNDISNRLENGKPIFVVFVNGDLVDPSYDSIVGHIEQIR